MYEEVGFQIPCFESALGEFGQPRKLIPAGQGILAFAYLSIKDGRLEQFRLLWSSYFCKAKTKVLLLDVWPCVV